jgi:hypothetical protein
VEGSCEHGDETSGSLNCWEVLERLHNWQLLKKGSAPQVSKYLASYARDANKPPHTCSCNMSVTVILF